MRSADRSPCGSLVENITDIFTLAGEADPSVRPRLAIHEEAFDLDLFEEGFTFVSERLVRAMALPADAAYLGEVDPGESSAAVCRMKYRTFSPAHRVDALDQDSSDGEIVNWIDANGVAKTDWLLAAPRPNAPPPRARWRDGLRPPAELFLVNGTPWRAATEALAERVTAIGAVGIDFVDPMASATTGDLIVRAR